MLTSTGCQPSLKNGGGSSEASSTPTTSGDTSVANAQGVDTTSGTAAASQILSGQKAWVKGSEITGTMAVGSSLMGTSGQLVLTLPEGYYDGTKTASATDSNLLATNIASGVSIFGVTGTASLESHSGCTASGQSGCVANASFLSGAPQSNFSGTNGQLVLTIPQGYYDGTKAATAGDTNLVTGNIRSGITIFGVSGNSNVVNTSTGDATAADLIVSKKAWVDGAEITGTIANNGTWNLTQSFATAGGAGYYGAVSNAPTAGLIKQGTTILGVAGSLNYGSLTASNACRDSGTTVLSNLAGQTTSTQLTLQQEASTYAGAALPTTGGLTYRDIPDSTKDDDGYIGTNCKYAPRPGTDCGLSGSLATRIADCVTQNSSSATWDGATQCNGGEGVWKLVTRKNANKEVWQDQRTGLIWSSKLGTTWNWCKASGNSQGAPVTFYQSYNTSAGTPMTGNGTMGAISGGSSSAGETITITLTSATAFTVSGANCGGGSITAGGLTTTAGSTATWSRAGYCSFTLTQGSTNFVANDIFILNSVLASSNSCAPGSTLQATNPAVSVCAEGAGLDPAVAGENWGTGTYDDAKGAMGKLSTPVVYWRLPTSKDYRIAETNGIRMVMPDMGIIGTSRPIPDGSVAGANEWTASVYSDIRLISWCFDSALGNVSNNFRTLSNAARCVGR